MQVLDGQLEKGKWLVGDEFTLVECDSAACRGAAVKSSSSSTGTCLPRTTPISALPMSCTARTTGFWLTLSIPKDRSFTRSTYRRRNRRYRRCQGGDFISFV